MLCVRHQERAASKSTFWDATPARVEVRHREQWDVADVVKVDTQGRRIKDDKTSKMPKAELDVRLEATTQRSKAPAQFKMEDASVIVCQRDETRWSRRRDQAIKRRREILERVLPIAERFLWERGHRADALPLKATPRRRDVRSRVCFTFGYAVAGQPLAEHRERFIFLGDHAHVRDVTRSSPGAGLLKWPSRWGTLGTRTAY